MRLRGNSSNTAPSSSSSSALIPLAILKPDEEDRPLRNGTELVVASPTTPPTAAAYSPHFRLPDGWTVEERPRSSALDGRVDRYYYEPGTGRQFRSMRAVEKHLIETKGGVLTMGTWKPGNEETMSRLAELRRKREMQIVCRTSPFKLPDDWIVEEKPRSNMKYAGVVDKYYIEPGTGQRFRSLRAVERYLTEMEEDTITLKALTSSPFTPSGNSDSWKEDISDENCSLELLKRYLIKAKKKTSPPKAFKPGNHSTSSVGTSSHQKNIYGKKGNTSILDSTSPPAKVNWVLTGTGGNLWSPFIGESMVAESVKQKWSDTFILALQD